MKQLRYIAPLVMAAIIVVWAPSAKAEVTAKSGDGFTVNLVRDIAAPQSRVWQALLKPSLWWHPEHTFSGDAANLHMSVPPGGCFCEKLPQMGGVRHMDVIHAAPPELLRLSGGLGPLQSFPVTGVMNWKLSPTGEAGTRFSLDYEVRGVPGADWAEAVDSVLGTQADRLKRYLETGKPAAEEG